LVFLENPCGIRSDRADRPSGDTKAGVLVGTDKFGNKFYENNDELPREPALL
jgi:hypothetical protein